MIQNTDNKPLSDLFSLDNKIKYHIPKYQREYVWSKWHWEALFDDIVESAGGHFLGSIICINTQTDNLLGSELELVDGQQRMTTLSLLYLAIYKFLKQNVEQSNDQEEAEFQLKSLKNRIFRNNDIRLTPSYSGGNKEDYQWIFHNVFKGSESTLRKPKHLGNRRISKVFDYFCGRLNIINEDNSPEYNFDRVFELLEKMNTATIVKIDVANHSDAFTLFETLNNRGVPLSAIDIIKNKLLGKLEKNNSDSLDENFERWSKIIENLSDEYKVQERFLRQYYNAFKIEDDLEIQKAPKALKSNLIRIYEVMINKDANDVLRKLENTSAIYSQHINYDSDDECSSKLIKALRNLENVNGADAYMLLLFLSKKFDISEDEKIKTIDLLCKYFLRRNITDIPNTQNLTNYFMDIIKELSSEEYFSFDKLRELIITVGKPASDEYFNDKLHGDLYEENVVATRFILSMIEANKTETDEKYVDFYQRNKKKFIWTIEHIFPQGQKIPQHWIDMIGDGDNEIANDIRKECVHKLGNLTLTGYNSSLSNMSFHDKKNRMKEGKHIGFLNGLYLNEILSEKGEWTKEDIVSRTDELAKLALEIFRF